MSGELERVRKTMRELQRSLKSLPKDPPPKEVHKLRTATRRVEAIATALPAGEAKRPRRLLKSLEPVRKAAGGVRDMDVLTANARRLARHCKGASLARLVELLQTSRQQNAAVLHRELGHRRKEARSRLKQYAHRVMSEMAPAESDSTGHAGNGHLHDEMHSVAAKYARGLSEWAALTPENVHAFRLKVKELRYTLQLFADADTEFVEALGDVQSRIGDWHDWHQLKEIAREIFDPEPDNALLIRVAEITKRKLDHALAAANALRRRYLRNTIPRALGC